MDKHSRILPAAFLLLLLLLWEIVPLLLGIQPYVFPRLSAIVPAVIEARDAVLLNTRTTFVEAINGFVLGSLIGFLTGVAMAESRAYARIMLPYVVASNAIPIVAVAPLVVIWFGHGLASKIILAAFLCFFPLCINTYRGLNEFDPKYKELFDIYGGTRLQFLLKFKLRNSLPYILAGLKLNATFSVIGAIVAEFIGASSGLGFGMLQATYTLNTPRLFGYLIIACGMGVLMYYVIGLLEYYLTKGGLYEKKM